MKKEPKFKAGDWVIDMEDKEIYLVSKILENTYELISNDGDYYHVPHYKVEDYCRLWTIQDGKDGDVLANDYYIVLFKRLWKCKKAFDWSCGIELADNMWHFDYKGEEDFDPIGFHPATKEQCDLLFQKMQEAGYEWDAGKLELSKIEQKPAKWSEEDEDIIYTLECILDEVEDETNSKTTEKIKNWLKSLRPQNRWKPSEEQIRALEKTLEYIPDDESLMPWIESLIDDFKKLQATKESYKKS